jgi:hypothetical protein
LTPLMMVEYCTFPKVESAFQGRHWLLMWFWLSSKLGPLPLVRRLLAKIVWLQTSENVSKRSSDHRRINRISTQKAPFRSCANCRWWSGSVSNLSMENDGHSPGAETSWIVTQNQGNVRV